MQPFFKSKEHLQWAPVWHVVIILAALSPLLVTLLASAIGAGLGCKINEAGTDPCVRLGLPLGDILSGMFVIGWFMLITVPLGIIAFIVFTIVAIRDYFYYND